MYLGDPAWEGVNPHIQLAETGRKLKLSRLYCMGRLNISMNSWGNTNFCSLFHLLRLCSLPSSHSGVELEGSLPACQGCCNGDSTLAGRDLLQHLPVWAKTWHFPSLSQQNTFSNYKLIVNHYVFLPLKISMQTLSTSFLIF